MMILGINAYHPDATVVLLHDGRILWAGEEERFNRLKHSSGFPAQALAACLRETEVPSRAIDAVALSRNPRANTLRKILFTLTQRPDLGFVSDRLRALGKASGFKKGVEAALSGLNSDLQADWVHVEHHRAHAASAFYVSGFEKAAFLSWDGMGDFASAMWGLAEGNRLHIYGKIFFPHSAGFLYTAGTQFLGFPHFGDEYKVMGLAGFGKPAFIKEFQRMIRLLPDGGFELDLDYFLHQKGRAKVQWESGSPTQDLMYSEKWTQTFGAPRDPEGPLTERDQNMAASMQSVLESILFHILRDLHKKTRVDCLCLAGGVAFNSVANGKITRETPFRHVYIQPAAGDAGTALGAACSYYYARHPKVHPFVMDHAAWGSEASEEEIEQALGREKLAFRKLSEEDLLTKAVQALTQGKIVGWFQGRMEFGPRALGNRSILADPRSPTMKDILNQKIKRRENFRPFAPSVPEEDASEFFEMDCKDSPFMLKVFPVRPEKKSALPAVTHVDGTARVQTVSKKAHPLFWKLLKEFGKATGVPVLLNTSFNENEPIVRTPEEAIRCFARNHMDVLAIGRFWVEAKT
jgi:carbamoyltransferase